MALRRYTFEDGNEIVLCHEHGPLAAQGRAVAEQAREQGGTWKCRVCTVHRRLTGGQLNPVSMLISINGGPQHVVTRFPTGVVMCDCIGWLKRRGVPPAQRRCKHSVAAIELDFGEKVDPNAHTQ